MSLHKKDTPPLVLLGDSNPESARSLTALLESWKYAVEVAGSGPEVLARLCEGLLPAVVLLENDLPQMSGIEVVQEWHRKPRQAPVWTMILSERATPEQVMMANDAGVNDFLVKPVSDLELQVRLKTAERVQTLHCELNRSIEAMRFRSSHDSLTGLWNRESMLGMLFQETDRVQRMQTSLSFMLVDLDDFSLVNAEHGFSGGDQVLQQIVERFRRYLRSYDVIGRYGEDEFLIALPGCDSDNAVMLGERLRRSIFRRAFDVGVDSVALTASFGVAQSKGRSPLVVLREAEHALSQAKLAGGDRVVSFGDTRPSPTKPQEPGASADAQGDSPPLA